MLEVSGRLRGFQDPKSKTVGPPFSSVPKAHSVFYSGRVYRFAVRIKISSLSSAHTPTSAEIDVVPTTKQVRLDH